MALDKHLLLVVFLFLQTLFGQSESKLVSPSVPLIVALGSDVTLSCQLDSVQDLRDLVVEWTRPDLKPRYVHIRRDGLDLLVDQNSLYQGRTRLEEQTLQYGDMSLKLSRARLSDTGMYRCFIPKMNTAAEVTLHVVSVSPVSFTLTKDHSGSPALRCESTGWFPEPQLDWLDSEGTNLTKGRTEVSLSNDETFRISSRLSVEQSYGNSFTCRVRQQQTKQSREAEVTIHDDFLKVLSCSASSCSVAWTLFALCFLLLGAVVAFVACKFKLLSQRFSSHGKKYELKDSELGEREENESMIQPEEDKSAVKTQVSVQSSDLKSPEHKDTLEKIKDELKFVEDVINKLTETKDFLMKLKDKPQDIIKQLHSQITVLEGKSYFPLNPEKGKKEKERKEQIEELKKQKAECERTVEELDQQNKTTEMMISEALQRKGKLDGEYERVLKLVEKEQRRPEATVAPEPQQGSNERKNVPVATIHALDQTGGTQGENKTEDGDVDALANKFSMNLNLHDKKVFPPSPGQS